MELFKEKYLTITLEEGKPAISMNWDGDPTPDEYKKGNTSLLDLLADKSATYLLLNYRNMSSYLSLDDQVWTIHHWFPKVKENQVRKVGVVVPKKMMTQIVIKSIFTGMTMGEIEIAFFDNIDDLRHWAN